MRSQEPLTRSLSRTLSLFGLPDKQARSTRRKTHSMLNLSLAQGWFSLRAGIFSCVTFLIEPGSVEASAALSCLSLALSPFIPLTLFRWLLACQQFDFRVN